MFLTLCWLFTLSVKLSVSESVKAAAEQSECHPWSFYNDTLEHCQCYDNNGCIMCLDKEAFVVIGCCMTTEDQGTFSVGSCAAVAYSLTVNFTVDHTYGMIQLPNNVSELNDFMCGPTNRKGRVCSECIDGFAPSVISTWHECSNCTGAWYGIPLYLFLEFVPITLFYLAVLIFQIIVISSPTTYCVMYSQLVVYCFTFNTPQVILKSGYAQKVIVKILLMFHGIWNLDFFRSILPPFCVSPNLNNIHIAFLGYISALYPILLIGFTWLSIQLYSRNYRPFVWLWKRLCCLLPNRNAKPKIVDTFATFFFLSYTKVCFISGSMLQKKFIYQANTTELDIVVSIQPNIRYLSKEHVPYAVIGAIVLLVFGVLPALLLAAYPSRRLRSLLLLHRLGGRSNAALSIFMEKFYSCYRDGLDGGRDLRSFTSLHLFVRLLTLLVGVWISPTILYGICCVLLFLVKPCKKSFVNNTDAFILGLLTLHSYLICDHILYSSFGMWITLFSAYIPLLIICINLVPHFKLKAAMIKFSCCNKLCRHKHEETEGEESSIDDDREISLHSYPND